MTIISTASRAASLLRRMSEGRADVRAPWYQILWCSYELCCGVLTSRCTFLLAFEKRSIAYGKKLITVVEPGIARSSFKWYSTIEGFHGEVKVRSGRGCGSVACRSDIPALILASGHDVRLASPHESGVQPSSIFTPPVPPPLLMTLNPNPAPAKQLAAFYRRICIPVCRKSGY